MWTRIKTAFEASPISRSDRTVFNTYHKLYDQFMRLFRLYETEEVGRTLPTRGRCLLDLGGGTGFLAEQFRWRFDLVLVTDISAQMLSVAQRRGLPVCQSSACALPLPAQSVDAIICTDALHHIKDHEGAVREMSRLLAPGGRVVIQDFHTRGVYGWFFYAFERLFVDHSEFILPEQLQRKMEEHGFNGGVRSLRRNGYIYEGQLSLEEGPCSGSIVSGLQ